MSFYPKQDPSLDESHWQKGGGHLSQWMKMVKGCNGLNWWGHRSVGSQCMHYLSILPTWASACAWHNRVDGGGLRFSAIFEDL